MSLITVSEEDLRDVLAAAFGRGMAFWNIYRPKNMLDIKEKMEKEKGATINDFVKFVKDQEQIRNAINKKRED